VERILTARRVHVDAAHREAWLQVQAELAGLAREAGRHKWLFRHPFDPQSFLEFDEGPAGALSPSSPRERALAERAAELADYSQADTSEWLAVPLGTAASGE